MNDKCRPLTQSLTQSHSRKTARSQKEGDASTWPNYPRHFVNIFIAGDATEALGPLTDEDALRRDVTGR